MTHTNQPKHLVLYVDDDRDDIALVEEAFSSTVNNIELVTAYDGVDAVTYLNSLSNFDPTPCLIILDVNMPKMNGREALLKIRQMERFKKTPVVLFTTSSMPMDKSFAEKHDAGFVNKPLNTDQMRRITDQFIEHCTEEVKKTVSRRI
jgi:CheY-like chemotaxis protein